MAQNDKFSFPFQNGGEKKRGYYVKMIDISQGKKKKNTQYPLRGHYKENIEIGCWPIAL